jgi:hypothetical protein
MELNQIKLAHYPRALPVAAPKSSTILPCDCCLDKFALLAGIPPVLWKWINTHATTYG